MKNKSGGQEDQFWAIGGVLIAVFAYSIIAALVNLAILKERLRNH